MSDREDRSDEPRNQSEFGTSTQSRWEEAELSKTTEYGNKKSNQRHGTTANQDAQKLKQNGS